MKFSVAIVFFMFAAFTALFFLNRTKPIFLCDENHPAVYQAKNLPREKLAALFKEAESIALPTRSWNESIIPLETKLGFTDSYSIKNSSVHYWTPDLASVKLAHCYDHSVSLSLEDLNKPGGSITLYWGEHTNGEQLLWTKPQ